MPIPDVYSNQEMAELRAIIPFRKNCEKVVIHKNKGSMRPYLTAHRKDSGRSSSIYESSSLPDQMLNVCLAKMGFDSHMSIGAERPQYEYAIERMRKDHNWEYDNEGALPSGKIECNFVAKEPAFKNRAIYKCSIPDALKKHSSTYINLQSAAKFNERGAFVQFAKGDIAGTDAMMGGQKIEEIQANKDWSQVRIKLNDYGDHDFAQKFVAILPSTVCQIATSPYNKNATTADCWRNVVHKNIRL